MSESGMRSQVVKGLFVLDAKAVENPAYPGTPDVNHIYGWIELKWIRRWPKNRDLVLKIDHFTPQQRVWLARRARHGGMVHVLLKVSTTWILLDGAWAAQHLGKTASHGDLLRNAIRSWSRGMNYAELIECLLPSKRETATL